MLAHPSTKERILLHVRDYCPYLRDAGHTFLAALCPEVSARACLPTALSAAAVNRPGGNLGTPLALQLVPAMPASSSFELYVPDDPPVSGYAPPAADVGDGNAEEDITAESTTKVRSLSWRQHLLSICLRMCLTTASASHACELR